MPFDLLNYDTLKTNTENLSTKYGNQIKRYKIIDIETVRMNKDASSNDLNPLYVMIARINNVTGCETDRLTEQSVFNTLVDEFRPSIGNPHKIEGLAAILLGALMHRYFRLLKHYPENPIPLSGLFFRWVPSAKPTPLSCRLFVAIRKALGLKDAHEGMNWRQDDLEKLDVETVVSNLKAFKTYMLAELEPGKPKYKEFVHFNSVDPNFVLYLDELIAEHETRDKIKSPKILKSFAAIRFIESLNNQINKNHLTIEAMINKWIPLLKTAYDDLSKVTAAQIDAHIRATFPEDIYRDLFLDLISAKVIIGKINTMDHKTLQTQLIRCSMSRASHLVSAGYVLLLQSVSITDEFKTELKNGLRNSHEKIPTKIAHTLISELREFLDQYPETVLNYDFFGDKANFLSALASETVRLSNALEAETNATSHTDSTPSVSL